jgi:hypothetical protein
VHAVLEVEQQLQDGRLVGHEPQRIPLRQI